MKHHGIDSGQEFDFGRTSEVYARYRDIYPQTMYDKLTAAGIGKEGQSILDLGSGTGVVALHLAETGARVTATDISSNQIAQAERLAADKGEKNISFKVCSAEDTGFSDNAFDAVTAVQCFHYFDPDKAAAEIRRILKPGGLFCKIFMDWLPYEDEVIAEMEALVKKYNHGTAVAFNVSTTPSPTGQKAASHPNLSNPTIPPSSSQKRHGSAGY